MVELVAHSLSLLEQNGIRLGDVDLHIQSDNTVREMKKQHFCSLDVHDGIKFCAPIGGLRVPPIGAQPRGRGSIVWLSSQVCPQKVSRRAYTLGFQTMLARFLGTVTAAS